MVGVQVDLASGHQDPPGSLYLCTDGFTVMIIYKQMTLRLFFIFNVMNDLYANLMFD